MPFVVMCLVLLSASLHATWNGLVKAGKDKYLDTVGMLTGAALLVLLWLPLLPVPARASWPYLAVSTLIHQVYFVLIVLSYRKGDISVVYPLTRGTAPALTAISSAVMLAEHPTGYGWLGVALVSGGVVLLAFDHRRSAGFHITPVLLALANAGVIALYTVSDGTGVRLSGNAFSYTCWGFLLCALLFTPVALLRRRREAVSHFRVQWRTSLVAGGCSIAAYSLALWAMTRAPIASVAALRETSILVGVLIAAYKLKERITRVRLWAALLVVAGAVIIKLG